LSLSTAPRRRGFTLLEVMVALTVLTVVVMFIYQVLQNSVRGQAMVREGLREPKVKNAILGQIFRDFRYLYWDGLAGNAGFVGTDRSVAGKEADSVDFVTARPSRGAHMEDEQARDQIPSPLTEVGYALRPNDENSDWLELWRREDWYVDGEPTKGGKYTLVYDKITRFNLQYFPIPEKNTDDKGLEEWNSAAKGELPYAIVLELEFDVEERNPDLEDLERETVSRIIILKAAYNVEPPAPPGQGNP
jgi:prepilin-type N-terminal cleavage/methylation domain-containing protein